MAAKAGKKRRTRTAVDHPAAAGALSAGIDLSTNCSNQVACIKQAGKSFIGRYYASPTSEKILTRSEAIAISRAGMNIIAVWEDGDPTSASYFSYAEGVDDGARAYNMASNIGQPAGTPIYFAVDYDASDADLAGGINDYFRGVRDGFATISGGQPVHTVAAYGSGAACSWLLARKLITHTWLAQSTDWRGYATFKTWNIKQYAETTLCGLDVDPDEAQPGYGGFRVP